MSNKNNMRISYPSSEKIYVEGEINKVKVGMRKIKLLDTVEEWYSKRKDLIQLDGLTSQYGRERLANPELDAIRFPKQHLPYKAKAGKNITQMYYAKKRIITPEMEYVAIRENQQIEAMGVKSYITPDFVRKEVAAGRAIIPANINHPEFRQTSITRKPSRWSLVNVSW